MKRLDQSQCGAAAPGTEWGAVPHELTGWYAIQVRPKSERMVAQVLTGKGYEVFLPLCLLRRRWSDRVTYVEQPVISNYVFCQLSDRAVAPVVTTPGVIRFVGCGRSLYPIAADEMEALQRIDAFRLRAEPWPCLHEGQLVEILDGPLRGIRGRLIKVKSADRLVITVSLLQRAVSVEVNVGSALPIQERQSA